MTPYPVAEILFGTRTEIRDGQGPRSVIERRPGGWSALLTCWAILSPATHAMGDWACGDLEHRFELIRTDIASDH